MLKLEFTCESGRTLITEQLDLHGTDAVIRFQVEEISGNGAEFIKYDGKRDCTTVETSPDRVAVSAIENTILGSINNRFDTPVKLDLTQTLDDGPITPPNSYSLPLPGQVIKESDEVNRQGKFFWQDDFSSPGDSGPYTLLPDMLWPLDQKQIPAGYTSLVAMEGFIESTGKPRLDND